MSNILVTPLEGTLHGGFCVDDIKTRVHEDFIRFTWDNKKVQVDIGCVTPPVEHVPPEVILDVLKHELWATVGSPLSPFIPKEQRIRMSLNEVEPKETLVVTYVYDELLERPIFEKISITSAKVQIRTYDAYSFEPECLDQIEVLTNILNAHGMEQFLRDLIQKIPEQRKRNADYLVILAMQLFNMKCRQIAKKQHTFSIERPNPIPGRRYFGTSNESPVFNRVLRDAMAFVNASNLVNFLAKKPSIYSKQFLTEKLPLWAFRLL